VPLTQHIATVSLTRDVSIGSLLQATAALQKQITRDFTPIWGVPATVDAFEDLLTIPTDYYPVILFTDLRELAQQLEPLIGGQPAARLLDAFDRGRFGGIHLNSLTRQPLALVSAADVWTVVLSHEVLELLADPYGNHLVAGSHPTDRSRRVNYLVEICDPCQAIWYPVNGVPLTDFYTPRYFDPVGVDGVRYSFTGTLPGPLEVLENGYVTFLDPRDGALHQYHGGDTEPIELVGADVLSSTSAPLRTVVDANPRSPRISVETLRAAPNAAAADAPYRGVAEAAEGTGRDTAEAIYALAAAMG
jgi:hypothetical protein